ncbi:hypothetical protein HN385_04335 [archaeon]|jgi:uncharacterized protein|nr:hypothetical protein [archaeon]MBT3451449.1 hypothetical protein [archaeon]MBT6868973.1 hypothetical protein [archaeon]MBT7193239.1 hypothetical protein [archaeon]MBT7380094.1 hypothetical protein [archaeon]
MEKFWKVNHVNKRKVNLHNPILIEGLPGIANVGKIAVDFLIEELKANKLCTFHSHHFPHSVFVNESNLVEMPKIELYYKKFKDKKKRDLLLLSGDVQPIDEASCYSFCETIIKLVKEYHCKEIITTGGIGLQNIPDKPKVYCTANSKEYLKELKNSKSGLHTNIFGVVGPIMGVSGILVGMSRRYKINSAAFLAETFGHQMYLGVKGAKEIVKVLNKKYKLKIDIKRLGKEILEIENEIMKKTKEWLVDSGKSNQAGAKPKNSEQSYIG